MSHTNDGGPAFPQNDGHLNRINNLDGMSLRDYFAGQALAGLCANPHVWEEWPYDIWPKEAYKFADTMLAAREAK